MKYLPFVVVLLLVGLTVGCAPTASQANREVTRSGNGLDLEPTLTGPNNASTPTPLVTLAPTNKSMAVPAVTPTPITTHTPTNTPVALSTALPTPTAAHTPTDTPATVPTVTVAPVSSIDSVTSEALVEYGIQVYEQQYCGVCHQLDAANTSGLFGPSQNGLGRTAEERIRTPGYTGQARTAAEYIRESILDPAAYYVEGYEQSRHHMPAFTHLSEAEVNALVQMLLQQK